MGPWRLNRNLGCVIPLSHHFVSNPDVLFVDQALDKAAKAEVDDAVEEAKASPEPAAKDLWTDIITRVLNLRPLSEFNSVAANTLTEGCGLRPHL